LALTLQFLTDRGKATNMVQRMTFREWAMHLSAKVRGEWFQVIMQEVRFGVRTLVKSRGIAAALILTLALGIGANTAIFSVVDAVLLRPIPYKNPARLLWVTQQALHSRIRLWSAFLLCITIYSGLGTENRVKHNTECLPKGN
jgi:hypothetical protein